MCLLGSCEHMYKKFWTQTFFEKIKNLHFQRNRSKLGPAPALSGVPPVKWHSLFFCRNVPIGFIWAYLSIIWGKKISLKDFKNSNLGQILAKKTERDTLYLVPCQMAHVIFLPKCVYSVRVSICTNNFAPKLFLKKSKTYIFSEIGAKLDPSPVRSASFLCHLWFICIYLSYGFALAYLSTIWCQKNEFL